ncbi:HmuY family protein [Tenacibaculum sp. nBUS_03]|uniref:HmuY family protein n=1 Tax=Tenacibaculum sp. nBUS_03 TaxID=3395320 RepID=UPI003EBDF204
MPNQPNQVYVDFSSNKETVVKRDVWDLGFYSGSNFRVALNGSLYMAAKALATTDMKSVTETSIESLKAEVKVGSFKESSADYVDNPDGDITKTAIAEVYADNTKNVVYLVNLGVGLETKEPAVGSVDVSGEARGWRKIRILRDGTNYKLQYANLDDTTFKEVVIKKQPDYNFTFFSLTGEKEVNVEPVKKDWDICFSVFTSVLGKNGAYGFSDYVFGNRKGGVTAYKVEGSAADYSAFNLAKVDRSLLKEDQTVIGSSWRNVFKKVVKEDVFYIVKVTNDIFYKVKFLSLVGIDQKRGKPRFEFKRLK